MWLRWALIAAAFVAATAVLMMFLFGDSECRNWQKAYTVVYEEHVNRTGPLVPSNILEDTESRVGNRPQGCAIPQPIED